MVIRLLSISEHLELPDFHRVFQAVLGWSGDPGYILRIHGQEFNGFRRRTRTKKLCDFRLHRQEKFFYASDMVNLWEWDMRILDVREGLPGAEPPVCVGGRGATPPQYCGGPRGSRLMLKRQREGEAISDPALLEAGIQWLASTQPEESAGTWDSLRTALKEGWESIDRRLEEYGPLQPNHFVLKEVNERLAQLSACGRFQS